MMKSGQRQVLGHWGLLGKINCRRGKTLENRREKLLRHCLKLLTNATATIFTGSLFIGGSYLFFIKLAEYGW